MEIRDNQGNVHNSLKEATMSDMLFKLEHLKLEIEKENGKIYINDDDKLVIEGFSKELETKINLSLED